MRETLRMADVASDVAGVAVCPASWDVGLAEAPFDLAVLWQRGAEEESPAARHALAVLHAPLVAYLMPGGILVPNGDPDPAWWWSWRLVTAVEEHRPGSSHFLVVAARAVACEGMVHARVDPGTPGGACGRSGPPDPVDRMVRDLAAIAGGEPERDLARRRGIDPMRAHALGYLARLYEGNLPRREGPGGAGVREPRRPLPAAPAVAAAARRGPRPPRGRSPG